jgi:hypothetical protein
LKGEDGLGNWKDWGFAWRWFAVEQSSSLRVFYGPCYSRTDRTLMMGYTLFHPTPHTYTHTQNKTLFTVVLFIESTVHFNNVVNFELK